MGMEKQQVNNLREITIVITNWNGFELLKETLPTVVACAQNDPVNIYEILMVDDCSTDESILFTEKHFPEIKILKTPQNLGYMGANNYGVLHARFPLVFCMNNDMKLEKDSIATLVPHFSDETVFAASGRIYDWKDKFLYGNRGGYFKRGHFSYFEKDEFETSSQTLFACGGAFLCRKKMYLDLGGYDAELYHPYYYDETDICFRALKKGWRIIYEPRSLCFHKVSQTRKKQLDDDETKIISARNNYFFSLKNIHDPSYTREMFLYVPLFLLRDALQGKKRFLKAFMEVIKKWDLVMKKRREEKHKGYIRSEKEIFNKIQVKK